MVILNRKGVTRTEQPDLLRALHAVSKAALADALLDAASRDTESCDADGDALVKAIGDILRPALENRGDEVPTLFRERA